MGKFYRLCFRLINNSLKLSMFFGSFPLSDVLRSAIGFVVFTSVLLIWAFTFAIGGKNLFGPSWENLALYRLADNFDLTSNF